MFSTNRLAREKFGASDLLKHNREDVSRIALASKVAFQRVLNLSWSGREDTAGGRVEMLSGLLFHRVQARALSIDVI